MHRVLRYLLVLNIVLCAIAVCVALMPTRLPKEQKTVSVVTHDTVVHVDRREQHLPESIAEAPTATAKQAHAPNSIENVKAFARTSPFYHEAAKVLSNRLDESDASNRRMILNYCEHLRSAYTTKDIDFIRQVFSDKALIIVGHVVKERQAGTGIQVECSQEKTEYLVHSKQQYLMRLAQVFKSNASIDVAFSDFRILRHPTMNGIYGVALRQSYKSDRYSDEGRLFLLWDFRNPDIPMIHVRVWQDATAGLAPDDVIGLGDFNLE